MNRTDRLLGIIIELQAKKWQRAEDLAATFEVTRRTIYRDMLALLETGVPVISVPGQGYSLAEGYFLPPVSFSTDEALLLLLGADSASQNFDAQYQLAAQTAMRKIQGVLPESFRLEVEFLRTSIRMIADRDSGPVRDILSLLRRAIIQSRTIAFDYFSRFGDSPTRRQADPYALIYVSQAWYLVAYCHLRQAIRHFRLDRMNTLTITAKPFARPADFTITSPDQSDRTLVVRILVHSAAVRWMRENPSYFQTDATEQPEGLVVTLHVRHEDEIIQWCLGWGANITILEPTSLQMRLVNAARALIEQYQQSPEPGNGFPETAEPQE
jgi:predicted DNA-binding transcriptional regulator YafY